MTKFRHVKSPSELTEAFRASGLKVTPQRQLLFRLMHGNTMHPTAEALFSEASTQMPGISLRTVYQTLTDLASMGELRLIDVGAGAFNTSQLVAANLSGSSAAVTKC